MNCFSQLSAGINFIAIGETGKTRHISKKWSSQPSVLLIAVLCIPSKYFHHFYVNEIIELHRRSLNITPP